MSGWIRAASFAGAFYPESSASLKSTLEDFEAADSSIIPAEEGKVVGIVSPHAGYVFSGGAASQSFRYASLQKPETVVTIGLAHRASLLGVSILEAEAVETPLGKIETDSEFGSRLRDRLPFAGFMKEVHLSEHSTETQFPFIKWRFPDAKVVEILTQDASEDVTKMLGEGIAETARQLGRKTLVVATTDLSHYPSAAVAEEIDRSSLKALSCLDPTVASRFIHDLEERGFPGVSCAVCSKAAVFAGMRASIELGAREGVILDYRNSGMAPMGDRNQVVGYGAVAWVR